MTLQVKRLYVAPKIMKHESVPALAAHLGLEIAAAASMSCDAHGTLTSVSKGFAEMLGATEAELLGKPLDTVTAGIPLDVEALFPELLQRNKTEGALLFKHSDGRSVLVYYRAHRSGQILKFDCHPIG